MAQDGKASGSGGESGFGHAGRGTGWVPRPSLMPVDRPYRIAWTVTIRVIERPATARRTFTWWEPTLASAPTFSVAPRRTDRASGRRASASDDRRRAGLRGRRRGGRAADRAAVSLAALNDRLIRWPRRHGRVERGERERAVHAVAAGWTLRILVALVPWDPRHRPCRHRPGHRPGASWRPGAAGGSRKEARVQGRSRAQGPGSDRVRSHLTTHVVANCELTGEPSCWFVRLP